MRSLTIRTTLCTTQTIPTSWSVTVRRWKRSNSNSPNSSRTTAASESFLALAEAAVIVRNCFLIPGRNLRLFCRTYLTRCRTVGIMAELKLQPVDSAQHLGMKLLHHDRIAGEPARIQAL